MPDTLTTTATEFAPNSARQAATVAQCVRGAFRFSDAFIEQDSRCRTGRREVIQFEDSTGLGVRVSQTGQISFIVQLKLKDGSRHRETLGAYGKLTIDSARAAAQAHGRQDRDGRRPATRARRGRGESESEGRSGGGEEVHGARC